MSQLEPTYLRYIYDGLVKGSIHPENAAELPDEVHFFLNNCMNFTKLFIQLIKTIPIFTAI